MLEQVALIIAMLSFFVAVVIFIGNILKFGLKDFSIKTRAAKISLRLMGVYAISFIVYLVLAN